MQINLVNLKTMTLTCRIKSRDTNHLEFGFSAIEVKKCLIQKKGYQKL